MSDIIGAIIFLSIAVGSILAVPVVLIVKEKMNK